jgi:hypothetical protein
MAEYFASAIEQQSAFEGVAPCCEVEVAALDINIRMFCVEPQWTAETALTPRPFYKCSAML